jgi:hypothetical protein
MFCDVGSNMFDNMKHCVAIGGADCCWGWGLLPMMAETLGGAGPGPIFNAEAAYSGICYIIHLIVEGCWLCLRFW